MRGVTMHGATIGLGRLAAAALVLSLLSACGRGEAPKPAPVEASTAAVTGPASRVHSPTLAAVKKRGVLNCGVHEGLVGFAYTDNRGEWRGFDVDFCRVMAASIFGDSSRVRFVPLTEIGRASCRERVF